MNPNDRPEDFLQKEELINKINALEEAERNLRNNYEDRINDLRLEKDQLNHANSVVLKRLSYKILNNLNGMLGIIDLLKSGHFDGDLGEYLHLLNSNGTHMLSTVNDILDFSAIRSGDLVVQFETIDLKAEMIDLISMLSTRTSIKNNILKLDILPGVPEKIVTDISRLRQILINLIDNSNNSTHDGEITVRIEHLGDIGDNVILVFKVEDNGTGINNQLIEKLHTALSHHNSDLLLRLPGTGMGLAIAKELCEIFDGELSFDATEGSINIFWFTATFKLPVEIIENQDIIKATSKTENGLKILLVEDNILNQKFAKASLVRKQHTIEIAENGKIAIDKYNNDDYDLILMDIQLPIMDGIEATKQIRELESISGKHIIIIAVTAYALERDRKRCFEAGMDGFLSKPFRPDDLYKIIEKCYNEKKGF